MPWALWKTPGNVDLKFFHGQVSVCVTWTYEKRGGGGGTGWDGGRNYLPANNSCWTIIYGSTVSAKASWILTKQSILLRVDGIYPQNVIEAFVPLLSAEVFLLHASNLRWCWELILKHQLFTACDGYRIFLKANMFIFV